MRVIIPAPITPDLVTSTNVLEDDAAAWTAGTYAEGDRVVHEHRVWESLAADNDTEPGASALWLDVSASNPYRMFDAIVGTQTVRNGTIEMQIEPGQQVTAAAYFGLAGTSLHHDVTVEGFGTVFDKTLPLIDLAEVVDWYSFLHAPVRLLKKAVLLDMPGFSAGVHNITIDRGENDAACGELVLGREVYIGETQFDFDVGIDDFSVKQRDPAFGGYRIAERDYAANGKYIVRVENSRLDFIFELLAELRAKPAVWLCSEIRRFTFLYGFPVSWRIAVPGPVRSTLSIEFTSLI